MNTFYNCNETYDGQNDVLELELFIAYGQELDTTSQNRHNTYVVNQFSVRINLAILEMCSMLNADMP